MSQFENRDGIQEGDQADRAEDVAPARDVRLRRSGARASRTRPRSSDLVADLTLAQGVTYTPGGLRVLRTSYVFRLNEHGPRQPGG